MLQHRDQDASQASALRPLYPLDRPIVGWKNRYAPQDDRPQIDALYGSHAVARSPGREAGGKPHPFTRPPESVGGLCFAPNWIGVGMPHA